MSEEIKNQQAAEPEALTETEINEQMQVRINKMHQIEEKKPKTKKQKKNTWWDSWLYLHM